MNEAIEPKAWHKELAIKICDSPGASVDAVARMIAAAEAEAYFEEHKATDAPLSPETAAEPSCPKCDMRPLAILRRESRLKNGAVYIGSFCAACGMMFSEQMIAPPRPPSGLLLPNPTLRHR